MERVIVYGLGERYQLFQSWENEWRDRYVILGVSDRFEPDSCSLAYEFIERERLGKVSLDLVIVTSDRYYEEIKEELIGYGVSGDSIVSMQMLFDEIHTKTLMLNKLAGKEGVEIGGPTYIFRNTVYPICKKCDNVIFSGSTVWGESSQRTWNDYAGRLLGEVLVSDVTDMNEIQNETYEFCISSNNLEHVANPMVAIKECLRVIKTGGTLLILVPFKEKCFDHLRDYSTFDHVLEDYNNATAEDDLSHLSEILEKHDFSMDIGCECVEEFINRANKNIENRCLHHHVFDEQLLIHIFEYFNVNIIRSGILGTNVYIIGEKN